MTVASRKRNTISLLYYGTNGLLLVFLTQIYSWYELLTGLSKNCNNRIFILRITKYSIHSEVETEHIWLNLNITLMPILKIVKSR